MSILSSQVFVIPHPTNVVLRNVNSGFAKMAHEFISPDKKNIMIFLSSKQRTNDTEINTLN